MNIGHLRIFLGIVLIICAAVLVDTTNLKVTPLAFLLIGAGSIIYHIVYKET